MNTQERWNYIKNNQEIIEQYMALHDEEVRTRQLVKFLGKQLPTPEATNEIL
jgi:sulfur transfer protein SufE